jgi:ubiquinone/menaquinone biosynthesis C-methylase UbiE
VRHLEAVNAEFTRQAATFAESPTLKAADVTERVAAALADLSGERVLDVACGPGILTNALASKAASVVGLDFTAEPLRLAAANTGEDLRASFVRGLAEGAPFSPGAFGGAVIRLALHHFEDPAAILREVRRVLTPGGRLVVLDILTTADAAQARLHNAIERLRDPSHTTFSSEPALRELIEASGFDLVTAETWAKPRRFADWAEVVNAPKRMAALAVLLEQLVHAGESAGVALREQAGELWFTYQWSLMVARARTSGRTFF